MNDTDAEIDLMFQVLNHNFYKLYILYQTNFEIDHEGSDQNLPKMFYETIGLIDDALKIRQPREFDACEYVKLLFEMIKFSNRDIMNVVVKKSVRSWSIVSKNVYLTEENILIASRVLIRIISNNQSKNQMAHLKEPVFKLFQEDYFLRLIASVIMDCKSMELTELAYEILFELVAISKENDFNYNFDLSKFVEYNLKLKER